MPVANITAARNAIYSALKTAMDASAYSALAVYYPDVTGAIPDTSTSHLRAQVDFVDENQVTLGSVNGRRFRVTGLVTVMVMTPYGKGQVDSDLISGVVKGAFRGVQTASDAITFRRVRIIDVGQSGAWLQTNVLAEFDYDEIA
jgi:Bacteriophage related domain of unknown function